MKTTEETYRLSFLTAEQLAKCHSHWSRDNADKKAEKVVYFIRGVLTNRVKIGIANNLLKRIRNLQLGSPDVLEVMGVIRCGAAAPIVESVLHCRFMGDRLHYEWFNLSPELAEFIEQHAAPPPFSLLSEVPKKDGRRKGGSGPRLRSQQPWFQKGQWQNESQ